MILIFVFAFAYRLVLMLWPTYPPGADIGLHNSVIYSITQSGNTNFLWDYYQMGGGNSLTFPGYHIFAAGVMMVTGMPDYLAQAVIVALFSALIVIAAFLITRAAWTESGAFIVAFLVAISRFDIEMLLWGGYPNVITLLLIPLTLYLYLQKDRFSISPFLVSTSILVGSIFLTHSLSAVVFVGITVVTVIIVTISPKISGNSRKNVFYFLLPIFIGAVLILPFIVEAVPAYLSSNAAFTGSVDIQSALLSTRILPLEIIVPLFAILVLFFFLSKEYRGRFFSLPSLVFFIWLLVPLVLTQGYLYRLYVDYNRFLYFLLLPVIALIGMFIDHGSLAFARVIDNYRSLTRQMRKARTTANKTTEQISARITRKTIYSILVLASLLIAFFAFPIFVTPMEGVAVQSFYQVMNNQRYQAILWAKANTPPDAKFVSDALYGWWFGGFAQRPTISAVDPQYLTVARELYPARNASLLLDTDYMIDNGYIQVREDGGYLGRHNPTFLADLNWTYFPYPFFQFNNSEIILLSRQGLTLKSSDITEIPVTNQQLITSEDGSTSTVIVDKANGNFKYSEILTMTKGLQFANLTITVQTNSQNTTLDWIYLTVNSQGAYRKPQNGNTIGMLDIGAKECGQLIFAQSQPENISTSLSATYPCITQLLYNLQGKSTAEIQILIGLYPVSDSEIGNMDQTLMNHEQNALKSQTQLLPLTTFDYQVAMQQYSVSYIANRDFELNPKFASDPNFSLVFINNEVAIFKVKANVNQVGR